MKLSDFDYNLPRELIANCHIEPRDHSRLLVLDRESGQIEHKHFYDILDYLKKGDVLVFNNSKVFKARIFGEKETGGKIEFLVIRAVDNFVWEAMVRGKVKIGDKIYFNVHLGSTQEHGTNILEAEIIKKNEKIYEVKFNKKAEEVFEYLEKCGEMPLPPYVKKNQKSKIKNQNFGATASQYLNPKKLKANEANEADFYQTVYAKNTGSVAAPTAGFHFTKELLDKLKKKGVECLEITLHVGPGTFVPVETENILEHKMHEEFFEVDAKIWEKILQAKEEGRRVIAVGTTTCRVLESLANKFSIFNFQFSINDSMNQLSNNPNGLKDPKNPNDPTWIFGSTDIFIYPHYDFRIVDALITNFHLPKSTLLMLVSAFANPKGMKGIEKIKKAYEKAMKKKYRVFSFGDSMLIK